MTTHFTRHRARPPRAFVSGQSGQRGVALGIALVILIVITLLGVTAVRRAQLQSRLSQNAEATVMARGTASVNALAILNTTPSLLSQAEKNFSMCWTDGATTVPKEVFTCGNTAGSATLAAFASGLPAPEKGGSYLAVRRETPEVLPMNTSRDVNSSGIAFNFANFSVLSGYDGSANADGIAEVSQGVLQPVVQTNPVEQSP